MYGPFTTRVYGVYKLSWPKNKIYNCINSYYRYIYNMSQDRSDGSGLQCFTGRFQTQYSHDMNGRDYIDQSVPYDIQLICLKFILKKRKYMEK